MVESLGGRLDAFYFVFGENDVHVILDLPENLTAAAISLAVMSTGAARMKTTRAPHARRDRSGGENAGRLPAARVADAIAEQPCEYLVQEATMAFVKTIMSVFGFPRFIPASRFFANAGETVTDSLRLRAGKVAPFPLKRRKSATICDLPIHNY
jgi:hypothetical protein